MGGTWEPGGVARYRGEGIAGFSDFFATFVVMFWNKTISKLHETIKSVRLTGGIAISGGAARILSGLRAGDRKCRADQAMDCRSAVAATGHANVRQGGNRTEAHGLVWRYR
ncbi:hypothetical protein D3C87_1617050 [compost metagenome]